VANSTIDNASLELTYRSKLANLYYSIREYEQSYNIYKAIIEKIPSNPRLHKAAGDSLRHLERYEEAIWLY
jgi:tetratricopeptide (TPR) repeat protein